MANEFPRWVRIATRQRGTVLMSVLVCLTIFLTIGSAVLAINLTSKFRMSDQTVEQGALHALSRSAARMRKADFETLVKYCGKKGVLRLTGGGGGNPDACAREGRLITTPSKDPADVDFELQIPLNVTADAGESQAIRLCQSVVECRVLGQGHLLDVALEQILFFPSTNRTVNRIRHFRRSKW